MGTRQIKWVTDSHFSSLYPSCISNIYTKTNKWAKKDWVGLCFSFQPWLCSCENLVGENVSWGRSRPVSVRWVILCGSSGCSQSKPPASSCGQHRSNAGWKEKGKIAVDLIHPRLWQVCFHAFWVFFFRLPKSLFSGHEVSPWWHCQMTASVTVRLSRSLHLVI